MHLTSSSPKASVQVQSRVPGSASPSKSLQSAPACRPAHASSKPPAPSERQPRAGASASAQAAGTVCARVAGAAALARGAALQCGAKH